MQYTDHNEDLQPEAPDPRVYNEENDSPEKDGFEQTLNDRDSYVGKDPHQSPENDLDRDMDIHDNGEEVDRGVGDSPGRGRSGLYPPPPQRNANGTTIQSENMTVAMRVLNMSEQEKE